MFIRGKQYIVGRHMGWLRERELPYYYCALVFACPASHCHFFPSSLGIDPSSMVLRGPFAHQENPGFPWWLRWLSVCLQCGRPRFDPCIGKILWRKKWQATPVLLPGKSHGGRSLVGYGPRGHKESDTTE